MTRATDRHWTLGSKLAVVGLPFLLFGLLLSALTLAVSWQLDGGAAAVNEAGRMRMQVYRMAWLAGRGDAAALQQQIQGFDASLALLRRGDVDRPLTMPWDDRVRARYAQVIQAWQGYRQAWQPGAAHPPAGQPTAAHPPAGGSPGSVPSAAPPAATVALIDDIDALVTAVEAHLSRLASTLHLLQIALLALGLIGAGVLVLTGYRFVIEPVRALEVAIGRVRAGDLDVRVAPASGDEFGSLAQGFNQMADELRTLYRDLEARVQSKTAELTEQREQLRTLYGISTLVTHASSLEEMAQGFVARVRQALHADAAILRWADPAGERWALLAADGLPAGLGEAEQCIRAGDCHCGATSGQQGARVVPLHPRPRRGRVDCEQAGWTNVLTQPIRFKDRLLGELDLFYQQPFAIDEAGRSLLDTLVGHLASGIENLRVNALERETAVAEERGFLARELHDSIAQALAFLKIQVQLMQDALVRGDQAAMRAVLEEIDLGVRESHGDVRELLTHFRTRTNTEDIEPALRTTLRKFEHQTGIPASLSLHGHGLPLPSDTQVQALHIVQEALSNVRKHARATRVWLEVWRQPAWRFEVRDDGAGFDAADAGCGEVNVGLRIMAERAQRLGARFSVESSPGHGTRVRLTLPAGAQADPPAARAVSS